MEKEDDPCSILVEDIDQDIIKRMPAWFRRLREAYQKGNSTSKAHFDIPKQDGSIDEDEFIRIVKIKNIRGVIYIPIRFPKTIKTIFETLDDKRDFVI